MTDIDNSQPQQTDPLVFSFGDPVPVLDGRDYLEMFEVLQHGDYYEPSINPQGLNRALRANTHHASAIQVKRNIIASCYMAHPKLKRSEFKRAVYDLLVHGNCYFEQIKNRMGGTIELKTSLAKYTRRRKDSRDFLMLRPDGNHHKFRRGSITHLMTEDLDQEIYGVPEYLAALQSALLNEAATLFRRKYYVNGSHAGFILYMTDAAHSQGDVEKLREAMRDAKGPGNFKNLFMYAPNGKPDGVKVIPIAEVQAKDEFLNIKNVTRDDVLAAHRMPPQLMGIIPSNTGGFGDTKTAAEVFARNELDPIMNVFLQLNDELGEEIIKFKDYVIGSSAARE